MPAPARSMRVWPRPRRLSEKLQPIAQVSLRQIERGNEPAGPGLALRAAYRDRAKPAGTSRT